MICRPRSSAEESVAETLVRARSAKDLRVQFREKKLAEREADSNQTGWALSLANRFMMDTQLDVSDVTFVYLDDSSGLLIGAHFESLEIKSTDERWRPKDEAEASTQQLFKLLCSEVGHRTFSDAGFVNLCWPTSRRPWRLQRYSGNAAVWQQ